MDLFAQPDAAPSCLVPDADPR